MAANSSENVLLQGYAVTGALAADQKIITQGYSSDRGVHTWCRRVVRFAQEHSSRFMTRRSERFAHEQTTPHR